MSQQESEQPAVLRAGPLGGMPWRTPDPFLFCVHHDDRYPRGNDQFGPAASLAGRDLGQDFGGRDGWNMYHGTVVPGFPQHPHRGFETVTVVRNGLLDHSDSLGAAARFGGGDVQWITAGSGLLHSEMFPLLRSDTPNPVELFQIWLNLPRADKMVEPHFSMLWSHAIPRHVARDDAGRVTEVTVIAGSLGGEKPPAPPPRSWAARADSDVAIWTLRLEAGARWTIPAAKKGSNRFLYFFKGASVRVGARDVPAGQLIELRAEVAAALENGSEESEFLMLQGQPINEPVVQHGPFVMNSRQEIIQAFQDYQRTGFGGWPWKRDDPVHPRDEGRFARHADGRLERPA
ncbi:pirin family protein [Myxococcus sp. K15C18031901]|uniref:pirin family protein n=1 Tax=Myxococcus dinghuensis TaxID=2906761 RepID=UPI0020A7D059|nr:pirin-like C-terminal cupin domain-containing protein [Myxococcus dinghuensis]MCP3099528.1 pirin family protein [Myxococcus dinghuensis]